MDNSMILKNMFESPKSDLQNITKQLRSYNSGSKYKYNQKLFGSTQGSNFSGLNTLADQIQSRLSTLTSDKKPVFDSPSYATLHT